METGFSPEVVRALINARKRGVDVRGVLDHKANAGKQNKASRAAMNLLVGAGIPLCTVNVFKILHDKVIVADGCNTQLGSYTLQHRRSVVMPRMWW
jgi:phosphatidylserine/phosphatidylglycerophosphate/cardiolipin synthase-like enzyme